MKYQCPKCGVILSDHDKRSSPGRHHGRNNRLYSTVCPRCNQESYAYNEKGNIDSGSWIELNDEGEPWEFNRDYKLHSFTPLNLNECSNTGCDECVYGKFKPDNSGHSDGCLYRRRLSVFQSGKCQPDLTAWGCV